MSSADDIRAAFKKSTLTKRPLEIPELGITVYVQKLSAYYSRRCQELTQIKNVDGAQFLTIDAVETGILKFAHGVVTEGGEQIFSEDEARELSQSHAEVFERVVDEVDDISDLAPEVIEAEEARFPEGEADEGEGAEDSSADRDGGPDGNVRTGSGDGDAPVGARAAHVG